MRRLGSGALLLLAACSGGADGAPDPEPDIRIACSIGGADGFQQQCGVERSMEDGQLYLVVRHPDGGFRRFEVLSDGHGVAVADGAQPAQISVREAGIEVTVGADRYRFPATIGGDGSD